MSNLNDLLEKMKRCSFRIKIEEENGVWYWGTGFFISKQGYALTAYHNLPKEVERAGAGLVDVYYGNLDDPLQLGWRKDLSRKDIDIAVLQLPNPFPTVFEPLTPAYLPINLPDLERLDFWRGRQLVVFGFPVRAIEEGQQVKASQADHLIEGTVPPQVFGEVTEYDIFGKRETTIKRLYVDGDRLEELGGISGGAVVDVETGWVVAVEGSYNWSAGQVFASELAVLVAHWPEESRDELRELEPHRHRSKTRHAAERAYLRALQAETNLLPLTALAEQSGEQVAGLTLNLVYIELDTDRYLSEMGELVHRAEESLSRREKEEKALSALAFANHCQYAVILGDPGSGKSSFLNHLTYLLAEKRLDPKAEIPATWKQGSLVPVRLLLRDVAAEFRQNEVARALELNAEDCQRKLTEACLAHLEQRLTAMKAPGMYPFLMEDLENGVCLVVFDGLDEVPLVERRLIRKTVQAFQMRYPHNRFLVTCRTRSYEEESSDEKEKSKMKGGPKQQKEGVKLAGFGQAILQPFDEPKMHRFIEGWYSAYVQQGLYTREQADQRIKDFKQAIRPLYDLASNPLLLTVMAIVHKVKFELPRERVRLYEYVCEILLKRWEQEKKETAGESSAGRSIFDELEIEEVQIYSALAELAYQVHAARLGGATGDIPRDEAMKILARHFRGSYSKAEQFLDYIDQRAGILIGRGGRSEAVYAFPHRTFQEYFAGQFITQSDEAEGMLFELLPEGRHWQLPVRLGMEDLIYRARSFPMAKLLTYALCPAAEPQNEAEWRGVMWAGAFAVMIGKDRICQTRQGEEFWSRLIRRLTAMAEEGHLAPAERAEGVEALGQLGDPRPGVGLDPQTNLPDICWLKVPAGEFPMGSNEKEDEKPIHKVYLSEFFISKYLLTNAQFGAFVEAGGYREQQWWTPEGWEWLQSKGITRPLYWDDPQWNSPNYPLVGVSWYEAVAFCRWLTAQLREQGKPGEIRLPTEAEWEKAASWDWRKEKKYVYPWGDKFDARKANTYEGERIGRTTPVGIYPDGGSPCGALDMSGNVLEWCRSTYRGYPYKADDGREELEQAGAHRVIRGGSWYDYASYAQCANRNLSDPGFRDLNVGFRLCR